MSGADKRWIGLVRNVMLGREGLHRRVLLDVITAAGGKEARAYLTTGNVTFTSSAEAVAASVDRAETMLAEVLGRRELIAVRRLSWLRALVARNPFAAYDGSEWRNEVAFLPLSAPALAQERLDATGSTVVVELGARELLAARPANGPPGPHANPLLERLSGVRATARGWSTLQRLAADRQHG